MLWNPFSQKPLATLQVGLVSNFSRMHRVLLRAEHSLSLGRLTLR